MSGTVILLGAGPGDAGLITVKGRAALKCADVVIYDALVGQGVLALIPPQIRRINAGKRGGHHLMPQDEINKLLLKEAQAGKCVVRLKGGDPFLFGRGGEELELLQKNNIPYEVIPGITSALAVPAYAGIPVTHRSLASSLHIITGHTKTDAQAATDYEALVKLGGTIVFLMGITALPQIMQGLLAGGISPQMPAAVLERGTTARQRRVVSTVQNLTDDAKKADVKTPAIIIVGEVCSLAESFHWAEDRALGGVCVAVTRPAESSSKLAQSLRLLGAEVLELPALTTNIIKPNSDFLQALNSVLKYSWLALTSPAGVRVFFELLAYYNIDIRALYGVKIAAVGKATAELLKQHGVLPELVPNEYSGAALGAELAKKAAGGRVLLLRAAQCGAGLTNALAEAGVQYDDIALYNTIYSSECDEGLQAQLAKKEVDYVMLTSASSVKGFAAMAGEAGLRGLKAICIGAQTAAEAEKHGMKITAAPVASIESMIETILKINEEEKRERRKA
ncbi:MAG: uroporphyrinogen-III C-methyltransferase [Hydrogenoanaerobacterium sp.]